MIKAWKKLNNVFKLSFQSLDRFYLFTFERSALLAAAGVGTGAAIEGIGSIGSFFISAA